MDSRAREAARGDGRGRGRGEVSVSWQERVVSRRETARKRRVSVLSFFYNRRNRNSTRRDSRGIAVALSEGKASTRFFQYVRYLSLVIVELDAL